MDNLEMENQFAEDNTFYRLIDRLEDTVDGAKNAPFSNDKIEDIIVGQDTCMAVLGILVLPESL